MLFLVPTMVKAQDSLSLSVTPPLFQLSAVPNQAWQSNIKIVNTNPFDITVYANPVNFTPVGEGGQGRFMPVMEAETEGQTLAEWITVTQDPIVVPKEQSLNIPFSIQVPNEPAPGGHFAAILVGTKPPADADGKTAVVTSQLVSSLVFLRIAGDVVEQARVREFSTAKWFGETPEAEFVLRFENTGNVHIRPQGTIVIQNMWGKVRGEIPINQNSSFGNVLPGTIRKFDFSWRGEQSFSDIGRYKAIVTLSFGSEARQNVTSTTIFWVIPIKASLIAFGILVVLYILIRRAIRSYVNLMLERAGIDPQLHRQRKARGDVTMLKRMRSTTITAGEEGTEDELEAKDAATTGWFGQRFIGKHWPLILGVPSVMLLLGLLFWFISGALTSERAFEAKIETNGTTQTVNSEEMRHEELLDPTAVESLEEMEQSFVLHVVNASGETGAGAEVAVMLAENKFKVDSIEPNLNDTRANTAIISHPSLAEEASALSKLLDNALISFSNAEEGLIPVITVIIGSDVK